MIGILHEPQRCAWPQPFHQRFEQAKVGQPVARALKKQHRHLDLEKMRGAFIRRPTGRMEWKAEKNKSADAGQRGGGLGLRRHAATKGFAAADERECGHEPRGLRHRGSNRRMCELFGPFSPLLHVWKLIAQCGDAALGEFPRNNLHEWVEHSRSRPMRQDVAGARLRGDQQQTGDGVCVIDSERQRFYI